MSRSEEQIKEEYQQGLDPAEFKDFKYQGLRGEKDENNYDFWFKCLYKFFSTTEFGPDSSLLELGSGPTVHNIASAAAFIPNIVQTELVAANCDQLRAWLRKDPDRFDWSPFLKRVARAEGRNDLDSACAEIEARIRGAVKAVGPCDVLDDGVVGPDVDRGPYDVLLSALTLETAAASKESFSAILKRVRTLIKPGGKLVLVGSFCSFWKVADKKFHHLRQEPEDIERALEENNYRDVKITLRDKLDDYLPFDCSGVYFLTCTKR